MGRDEEIAQATLMLACNQYAYGQVCISYFYFSTAFMSLRRLRSMVVTFWHMADLLHGDLHILAYC